MSDQTDELLRQILDTQRQLLAEYQGEIERRTEVRAAAANMKPKNPQEIAISTIIVGIGIGLLILTVVIFEMTSSPL